MIKKCMFTLVLGLLSFGVVAQEKDSTEEEGFEFTTVKECPITSIKNQNRSSTCWSFSSVGFIESELLRKGKGTFDLSEMFIVHHTMIDRAVNYVRLHGESSFAPGGSFNDVFYCLANYGIVPQEAMNGIQYGDTLPVHNELDVVAEAYVKAIAGSELKKLTPVWKQGLIGIYDTYLGVCPQQFFYKGKNYTPQTFAKELAIDVNDYVSITSYTHHPFYEPFAIEVQDNWRMGNSINLPLDEMMEVIDNAIGKGYTVAWGADVSETGFSRDGVGVMPDDAHGAELTGSDMAKWTGMSIANRRKELTSRPLPEKTITQEMRQTAYDNWETTDDHGMLIYGIAKDQMGKPYYMVKNSWGKSSKYNGIWYVSKAFVAYKTMNVIVHKDALTKAIAKKIKKN